MNRLEPAPDSANEPCSVTVRKFHSGDYPDIARIQSAIYTDIQFDPECLEAQDTALPETCRFRRWVGLCNNSVVAFGEYRQSPEMYQPDRYIMTISVHPEHIGIGFGSKLFEHVASSLSVYGPVTIHTTARSEDTRSIRFLNERGFSATMRIQEWRRDLTSYEWEREDAAPPKCAIFATVQELHSDPDRNRKLYDLISSIREDVPLPHSGTRVSFRRFEESVLESPSFEPDLAFVALHNGDYIGYSDARQSGPDSLCTSLTGVRRGFRGRGIATELKKCGIRCGRRLGYHTISSYCSSENGAIQSINRACGFIQHSEWTHFVSLGENSWRSL